MKQPCFFISHGGGPCFWMSFPPPFGEHAFDHLREYLSGLIAALPERPKAVLMVSAHWEEALPTVGSAAQPGMIYDYYGFPADTYHLSYPAPGAPELAQRAKKLLTAAGIATAEDAERGYDHGVFVPMMIIDPEAQIPVATLSLRHDLSARKHLEIGAALEPLREEGVLIIGSGNSFHDLRSIFNGRPGESEKFDAWLTEAVESADPAIRAQKLRDWALAPGARACHPREEHILPLMVVAGAAGAEVGQRDYHDVIGGKTYSGYRFG